MAGGGVANHYRTLGVAPWAEDTVIRAAYVALMRTYHPDRNKDPEAEARVREITSAFSVLGDPQRRAAYDALGALRKETGIGEDFEPRPPRPPMRNMGIASVALAVVVSLAFVAWPKVSPPTGPNLHRAAVAKPETAHVATAPALPPPAPKLFVQPARVSSPVAPAPVKTIAPKPPVREATLPQPKSHAPGPSKREIALKAVPKTLAPMHVSVQAAPAPVSPPVAAKADDRRAQVERIATGFLRQSLDHADSAKQQLLLSASSRAATLRAACRSDDCVTGTYLRQIRDTSAIMEGRSPSR